MLWGFSRSNPKGGRRVRGNSLGTVEGTEEGGEGGGDSAEKLRPSPEQSYSIPNRKKKELCTYCSMRNTKEKIDGRVIWIQLKRESKTLTFSYRKGDITSACAHIW